MSEPDPIWGPFTTAGQPIDAAEFEKAMNVLHALCLNVQDINNALRSHADAIHELADLVRRLPSSDS